MTRNFCRVHTCYTVREAGDTITGHIQRHRRHQNAALNSKKKSKRHGFGVLNSFYLCHSPPRTFLLQAFPLARFPIIYINSHFHQSLFIQSSNPLFTFFFSIPTQMAKFHLSGFVCVALLLLVMSAFNASHARGIHGCILRGTESGKEEIRSELELKISTFNSDGSSGRSEEALRKSNGWRYNRDSQKEARTKYGRLVLNFLPKGTKTPSSPSVRHNDFNS